MGSENSKSERKMEERYDDRLHTEMAIQQALEQQRKMYEKKCEKLIQAQAQSVSQATQLLQQNNTIRSNTPSITPQTPLSSTSGSLYPNVQSPRTPQLTINTNYPSHPVVYHSINQQHAPLGQISSPKVTQQNPVALTPGYMLYPQVQYAAPSPLSFTNNYLQSTAYPPPPGSQPNAKSQFHVNRSNTPNVAHQSPSKPAALYPNIQSSIINNNMQSAPNVNKRPAPYVEFQYSPSVPSAPEASADDENDNQTGLHTGARSKSRTRVQQRKKNETQLVSCVTCSKPLESNIYNCQKGHSSCNLCRTRKRPCGVCSSLILEMRNITLESTIADNNMVMKNNNEPRIKCPNSSNGCRLTFNKEAMNSHLKECPFRFLDCLLSRNGCKWQGRVNQLSSHFKEMHPENCEANVDMEMTLLNNHNDPYVNEIMHFVAIGAFNFLVHIKRDIQKTIYMTVQLFGTKVSASKWTYEIHVYNKKTPRRKYQYVDICHSDTTSLQELFETGQCAVIPMDYAKTFLDNNRLTYKFCLKKDIDVTRNSYKPQNTDQSV